MRIVTIPDKVLFKKAKPVTDFGPKLHTIIKDMVKTLHACKDPVGVGLAAPQVGLPYRIFIIRPTPDGPTSAFINPQIITISKSAKHKKESSHEGSEPLEGCLSIPRIWGPVVRSGKVTLRWVDEQGVSHEGEFRDFDAAIIQHEMDHLDGILFTHRLSEQKAPIYEERDKKLHELL